MAHPDKDRASAQENFAHMLKKTRSAVNLLRNQRKGDRGVHDTQELLAVSRFGEASRSATLQGVPGKRQSRVQITIPTGSTEFRSTVAVARRLASLSEETGEIVCMRVQGEESHCLDCRRKCDNLKSIWQRAGKESPEVRVERGPLKEVLESRPVLILIDNGGIPEGSIPGYHKVTLNETCFLLRMNGEEG